MPRYRRRQEDIEAVRFDSSSAESVWRFLKEDRIKFRHHPGDSFAYFQPRDYAYQLLDGDYIVRRASGEYHVFSSLMFNETYELTEETSHHG